MATNTKIMVNGKAVTNEEYVQILKEARETLKQYKESPAYKERQEAVAKVNKRKEEMIKKLFDFCEKNGFNKKEAGLLGYSLYSESRKEQNGKRILQ